MTSKHYVAITPLYPFPQPKFHRYVSACLGIGTHILSHLYFHFMGRYIRGHATQRARPALVYTRQISSPVPSINQSPYYVVHRIYRKSIGELRVSIGFSMSARPVASYRSLPPPSSLPRKLPSTSKFPAGAHAPPLRQREEREGLFVIYEKLDLSDPGLCSRRDSYFRC